MIVFLIQLFTCNPYFESTLESSITSFPADSISGGKVIFKRAFLRKDSLILPDNKNPSIRITGIEDQERITIVYFQSTKIPGKAEFHTENGKNLTLKFYEVSGDTDSDGFPDSAELPTEEERARFRNWFVRIAESQYVKPGSYWNPKERDCAGLIRYAYREALKIHDTDWQKKSGIVLDKNLPDIESYHYPEIPILGRKIFKIKKGDFSDPESFDSFADAETIFRWNTTYISKNILDAKRGDILFFENRGDIQFPFHSMIVAEVSGKEPIVIYHTGSGDILKRVPLSYLEKSRVFRVSPENPYFLGVYRFHILE